MDYEKLEKLVNDQEIMSLALVTPKGLPHNTPVWATYHDKAIYVFTRASRIKPKLAQKNPNCMVAFDWGAVRGKVELIYRDDPEYKNIMDVPDERYGKHSGYEEYKHNWDVAMKIIPTKLY